MIRLMAPVLVLCLAAVVPVCADYTVFVDPTGLFQTSIPQEWYIRRSPAAISSAYFTALEVTIWCILKFWNQLHTQTLTSILIMSLPSCKARWA